METKKECLCGTSEYDVVSCSGACDLGEITDLVARRLRNNNVRKMNCLALIAIDNKPLIETFKTANVLVLDGCSMDCSRKIMETVGLTEFNHLRLTDLGYEKGKTGVNEETIQAIYEKTIVLS